MPNALASSASFKTPIKPLWLWFTSASRNTTFEKSLKKGLKKALVKIVN